MNHFDRIFERPCSPRRAPRQGIIEGGTGHWPVPPGDPPDGTGEAIFLHAETVAHRAPLSVQPGW